MASDSPHTGSAPATYQTHNASDVILEDRCPFMMQRIDHLRRYSNIMMTPDVTPLNIPNVFIGIENWRSIFSKSLDKHAIVLA